MSQTLPSQSPPWSLQKSLAIPPSENVNYSYHNNAKWQRNVVILVHIMRAIQTLRQDPVWPQLHSWGFVFCGAAAQLWPWPPHFWGFLITHNDAPQSVGLLWTSDQLVADTSTWQHITLTTDKHPCSRRDSNPRSQQASGLIPTP